MVRAFLPRMLEMDKGSVVSLCSIAGHAGAPHMVPYSASKFAVKGMMEALHQVKSKNLTYYFNLHVCWSFESTAYTQYHFIRTTFIRNSAQNFDELIIETIHKLFEGGAK